MPALVVGMGFSSEDWDQFADLDRGCAPPGVELPIGREAEWPADEDREPRVGRLGPKGGQTAPDLADGLPGRSVVAGKRNVGER